jgi:hypothetical protein
MAKEGEKLETASGEKVGYNYAFSSDLGSGRIIQVTGVFHVGVTEATMNAEFDKLRNVLNRQVAKSAIPAIEEEVEAIQRTIDGLSEDLAAAEERFSGKRLPDNEAASHNNIKVSLRNLQSKLADKQKFLEKTRKEAE